MYGWFCSCEVDLSIHFSCWPWSMYSDGRVTPQSEYNNTVKRISSSTPNVWLKKSTQPLLEIHLHHSFERMKVLSRKLLVEQWLPPKVELLTVDNHPLPLLLCCNGLQTWMFTCHFPTYCDQRVASLPCVIHSGK